jgi:transcriptional regulator with XRE-family HTH domain
MGSNHKKTRTRLRAWREDAGLTLTQAASALQVSAATLGPIELGRLVPSPVIAGRLEAAFGEPAEALLRSAPRGTLPRLVLTK